DLAFVPEAEWLVRRGPLRSGTIPGRTKGGGSTWQSLARGAESLECEYLNGEIALLGRQHGVPTPLNDALLREVTRAAIVGTRAGSLSLAELSARLGSDTTCTTTGG
nr:ketopantoate reductase family protein [Deltaproteobacteria bacterium]